jgi:uncharacterized protein YcgI (DUF1989 family)
VQKPKPENHRISEALSDQSAQERFEVWLQRCPQEMKMALIDVCDTAEMCRRWFEGQGVPYSASDLVAMSALVLAREARRQESGHDE